MKILNDTFKRFILPALTCGQCTTDMRTSCLHMLQTQIILPTAEQRAAVVAEVVQSVVRSASALLDPGCVYGAWLDLDGGWVLYG